jgi:hypothetical protein
LNTIFVIIELQGTTCAHLHLSTSSNSSCPDSRSGDVAKPPTTGFIARKLKNSLNCLAPFKCHLSLGIIADLQEF